MAATLRGMPQVLVRIDSAGEYPVVVEDDATLLSGGGARWRYVCDVGSVAEGHEVCAAWLLRRQSLARNQDGGSNPPTPTT
jgi:hypothetical protein